MSDSDDDTVYGGVGENYSDEDSDDEGRQTGYLADILDRLQGRKPPGTAHSGNLPATLPVLGVFHAFGSFKSGDCESLLKLGINPNRVFKEVYDTQRLAEDLRIRSHTFNQSGDTIKLIDLLKSLGAPKWLLDHLHNAGNDAYATAWAFLHLLLRFAQGRQTPGFLPATFWRSLGQGGYLLVVIDVESASISRGKGRPSMVLDTEFGMTVIDTRRFASLPVGADPMSISTTYHTIVADNIHAYNSGWAKAVQYNKERFTFMRGPHGTQKASYKLPQLPNSPPVVKQKPVDSEVLWQDELKDWITSKWTVLMPTAPAVVPAAHSGNLPATLTAGAAAVTPISTTTTSTMSVEMTGTSSATTMTDTAMASTSTDLVHAAHSGNLPATLTASTSSLDTVPHVTQDSTTSTTVGASSSSDTVPAAHSGILPATLTAGAVVAAAPTKVVEVLSDGTTRTHEYGAFGPNGRLSGPQCDCNHRAMKPCNLKDRFTNTLFCQGYISSKCAFGQVCGMATQCPACKIILCRRCWDVATGSAHYYRASHAEGSERNANRRREQERMENESHVDDEENEDWRMDTYDG
ncbi:hypothetical protein LTR17_015691 [Elasticomyces elasticus]|nr:hypothetical protein LTR17_015691 [Elasticomyces elasticus]